MLDSKRDFVISILVTLIVVTAGGIFASKLGKEFARIESGVEASLSIESGKHYIIMTPIDDEGEIILDSQLGYQDCKDSTYSCSYFELGGYNYEGMIERSNGDSLKINSTYAGVVLVYEKSGLIYNLVGVTSLSFIVATVIIGLRYKKQAERNEAKKLEENLTKQREHELQLMAMSANNSGNIDQTYQNQQQPMNYGTLDPSVQMMAQDFMTLHNAGMIPSNQPTTNIPVPESNKKSRGVGRKIAGSIVKGAIGLLASRPDSTRKFRCIKCRQTKIIEGPGPSPKCCGKLMHARFD